MSSCITPLTLWLPEGRRKNSDYAAVKVPCGKCLQCLKRRAVMWSFRLNQERLFSLSSFFLTITYDDAHLPFGDGAPSLYYPDMQLFMKRLRKQHDKYFIPGRKIKYYTVGEYGSQTQRPHYHSIIFGLDQKFVSPYYDDYGNVDFDCVTSPCERLWRKGAIHVGEVTPASIAYTTGYVMKPVIVPEGVERSKALISKGLGIHYLQAETVDYYKRMRIPYIVTAGGQRIPMPRYYRDRIYSESDKQLIINELQDYFLSLGDRFPDYHTERETVIDSARKRDLLHRKRSSI